MDERRSDELNRAVAEADYVTVASGSAVHAFCKMVPDYPALDAKVVSIGPSTTKTAQELGLPVYKSASEYTAAGIAEAILADVMQEEMSK